MTTGDSSFNKKKRKYTKKTTQAGLSAINNDKKINNDLTPDVHVESVIKEAFLRFYDNKSLKQQKIRDLEHLDNVVEEFLKTFIILGYDFNGEKVQIMHASNPLDKDALVEHLRTTLLGILNKDG
jgi:hypothetical protein